MIELNNSLQQSLGARVILERALGGGMSQVYLARDSQLDRQVVVKLLPADHASGVDVERFAREIRTLAQLQHPYIIPILSAGDANGAPWYTMPYVEGESLRVQLERAGELPVTVVEQVLRDVLDALIYAHEHGVVHRDIKPDNILLAGGHAVLSDFGIARAIAGATGEHRLTHTGVALGTPAYMAPEQIGGDALLDHRADLYALGATAFHLLTGTTPFAAASTQALLLQHMAAPAPAVTMRRPSVPPALRDFIATCLEKRPADRYQTAREARAALDAGLATPRSLPAAPRPARPLAVAVGRAVATMAGALALTAVAVRVFGMPWWVLGVGAGVAVLIVALAIVANRYEHRHAATPTSAPPPITRGRVRRTGAIGFAALTGVAALFMISRATGIGPGATLLSAGTLAPRDKLVMADVTGAPNDTLLPAVTQLLRIALSQTTAVTMLDAPRLSEALARMQRDPKAAVTDDVAHEVATRLGLKAYITSTLVRAGGGWVLAASVVRTTDREPLLQVSERIATPDGLIRGVDRLAARVREQLGESLRTVRADPPLEDITTRSLTALRFWDAAQRTADASGSEEAVALLDRAIAADSEFAMAWRQKGAYLTNALLNSPSYVQGVAALRRAYALRDRLPTRERLLVEGTVASSLDNRQEDAISAYRSLLSQFPDDRIAQNNLSAALSRAGRGIEAIQVVRESMRDGTAASITYSNGLLGAAGLGMWALVDSLKREAAIAHPGSSDLRVALATIAAAQLDTAYVDSVAKTLDASPRFERANLLVAVGSVDALRGHLDAADRRFVQSLQTGAANSTTSPANLALQRAVNRAILGRDAQGDSAAMRRDVREKWFAYQASLGSAPPGLRQVFRTARALAQLGDPTAARAILAAPLAAATPNGYPAVGAHANVLLVRAAIAIAERRPDDALQHVREACEMTFRVYSSCANHALMETAEAYEVAGRGDSAIAVYRRFLSETGMRQLGALGTFDVVTPRVPLVWKRLGSLLDAKGDTAAALEAYGKFVAYWRGADADLQPFVRRVTKRMEELRSAPVRRRG